MKGYIFYILLFSNLLLSCNPDSGNSGKQSMQSVQSPKNTAAGQTISKIVFKTMNGKDTLLNGITHNKASVFIFLSPECPLSQSYSLPLNEFSEKYKKNNICFYGIFPGTLYTKDEMSDFQKKYSIQFPLLVDTSYSLIHIFNASVTPEVFVTDSTGKVLYSGRIDNWAYEVSKKRALITEHNLQDALDCIVNNTPIAVTKTKAVGCFIENSGK
jgi:peroxiredoxin